MRVKEMLAAATQALLKAGVDDARLEARRLLCWAARIDHAALIGLETLHPSVVARFESALRRRAAREPFAFITGAQGFWDQTLQVSKDTLIPRADSETLITALLMCVPDHESGLRILDLGTGTGCLLLAALGAYPLATGLGVDRVHAATRLALQNARKNGLESRASFMTGHWADAISATFDVVLSNPPYIRQDELPALMPEVRGHEPSSALDGGPSGLDAYRMIIKQLPRLLSERGIAIFELGDGQVDAVLEIARAHGMKEHTRMKDIAGIERALVLHVNSK